MRKIERRAKELGIQDVHRSEGRSHELLICRGIKVAIPRHKEINTFTAERIMKSLESVLGKGWWRNV